MTRFSEYKDAAADGAIELPWRHDLVDSSGSLLATTDEDAVVDGVMHWGAEVQPLSFASNRVSQRSADMTLPVTNQDLVPSWIGSLIHPESGNRVRLNAGFVGPNGQPIYHEQGTLLPDKVTGTSSEGVATLDVDLVDTLRPIRTKLTSAVSFTRGEPVENVVRALTEDVIPDITVVPTGFVMPSGLIPQGADRWTAINAMLEGCGHELVSGELGSVYTRPIPATTGSNDAERWFYGDNGLPVMSWERSWSASVIQGWEVQGGSLQSTSAAVNIVVFDTDPTSEGYFKGDGSFNIGKSSYPWVEQTPQAAAAGYGQLRRHGIGPMIVQFTCSPNPAMREGDLMELVHEELRIAGTFRVLSYRLPLQVDGLMTVRARHVYDPAVGFDELINPDAVCKISATDTFDRPDQNLENAGDPIGSLPGSPDWTEIGHSWGVINGRAIQRAFGQWSLAFCNTPMCSSNQQTTIDIHQVPAGRRIGPVVRASGQMDGYAALIDHNGRISLEMWFAGRSEQVLGSHSSDSSPAGKSLSISAIGSLITVKLGSETVLTANDTRRTGSHTGMLGYGGQQSNAPGVDRFIAEGV